MSEETKKPANKMKLNRSQIREALDQIPLENIIGGEGKKRTLTAKQRGFVRDVALGVPKAQAYRNNYNSKTKPKYQGDAGYKMANNPVINQEIEAFKVALEAREYQESTKLKAFIMHQLTLHALNEDNPPASRIRSLELLGKTYDVGLFVDRKEVTTINNSSDIKAKLIEQLKQAINKNAIDVDYTEADSLLNEIQGNEMDILEGDKATPTPKMSVRGGMVDVHSIPYSESPKNKHNESSENDQEQCVSTFHNTLQNEENEKIEKNSVDFKGEFPSSVNVNRCRDENDSQLGGRGEENLGENDVENIGNTPGSELKIKG